MKRFLKFLATLLAMTLIIGTVPVSAASGLTFKNPSKAIYVGKCTGTKSNGKKAKNKTYCKATSLVEGYDSKTMSLKVTSSDKSIVTANAEADKPMAAMKSARSLFIFAPNLPFDD